MRGLAIETIGLFMDGQMAPTLRREPTVSERVIAEFEAIEGKRYQKQERYR